MSKRYFNVAGPCIPGEHYMLDPMRGIEGELMPLIDGKQYFVIHAARQTGKTTLLKELVRRINAVGKYYALYCSLESIQAFTDPKDGIPEIVKTIEICIKEHGFPEGFAKDADYSHISGVLKSSLAGYCRTLDRPLVMFFDESDALKEGTLITFLGQLRDGHNSRDMTPFVHSVALVGVRDLRDYKPRYRTDADSRHILSPFNIITNSHNLRNFAHAEVRELYAQHTAETGQVFESSLIDYVFEQTQGQPWLVNSIACECVVKILNNDPALPVSQSHAHQAIQNIVRDRRTHIDSMMDKLRHPQVRNIMIPLITGDIITDRDSDDYLFTKDLGLIRDDRGKVEPANPIYAELIIRTLNWSVQDSITHTHPEYELPKYLKDDKIDMDYLIREFQGFWRENGGVWERHFEKSEYKYNEATAQLVLQGFLQRVLNGGGQVIREMAANTGRANLCVIYKDQKYPIEIKILQNEANRADSYGQILKYMDTFGANTGWLIIFDKRAGSSWDDKIYMREETVEGKRVVVAGC